MFLSVFIRILRSWQKRHHLVALFVHSQGKHTETSVLLDDTGSAYQIAVQASWFCLRPRVTVSEYVPNLGRILHQESFHSWLFTFSSDLEYALSFVHRWMAENGGKRAPREDEVELVQKMYAKTGK